MEKSYRSCLCLPDLIGGLYRFFWGDLKQNPEYQRLVEINSELKKFDATYTRIQAERVHIIETLAQLGFEADCLLQKNEESKSSLDSKEAPLPFEQEKMQPEVAKYARLLQSLDEYPEPEFDRKNITSALIQTTSGTLIAHHAAVEALAGEIFAYLNELKDRAAAVYVEQMKL